LTLHSSTTQHTNTPNTTTATKIIQYNIIIASPNSSAEIWLVEVTTVPRLSPEVQAKVVRLQADTRELVAEKDRFAAISKYCRNKCYEFEAD